MTSVYGVMGSPLGWCMGRGVFFVFCLFFFGVLGRCWLWWFLVPGFFCVGLFSVGLVAGLIFFWVFLVCGLGLFFCFGLVVFGVCLIFAWCFCGFVLLCGWVGGLVGCLFGVFWWWFVVGVFSVVFGCGFFLFPGFFFVLFVCLCGFAFGFLVFFCLLV